MYEIRRSSFGSSLVEIVLLLAAIGFFLLVVTVVYVVKTFVKYHTHKSLWIALAVCLAFCVIGGLLAVAVYQAFLALAYIGVAVLLITCFAVDLKNRDTLMRENVNLIDQVLRSSWWGSEDTPRSEQEIEPIAA
jgi:Na+/proline symporter